jgi:GNAT superfamily N-acetyltransferase
VEALRKPTFSELNDPGKELLSVRLGTRRSWSQATLTEIVGRRHVDGVSLTEVYTTPALRGRGLARRSIETLLKYAASNLWPVFLYVHPYGRTSAACRLSEAGLISFYARLGFALVETKDIESPVMVYESHR